MEKAVRLFIVLLLGLPFTTIAQTPPVLSNPSACQLGLAIKDDSCPEDSPVYQPNIYNIQVTGAPGTQLGVDVYLKEVRLIIRHPWLNDLDINLQSPAGKRIVLSSDNGGSRGDNYGNPDDINCDSAVVFLANACLSVEEAIAPYLDGPVHAEEHFYTFNDSITNPNGTWQLIICDDVDEDAGTLEFVELVFEPISCLPIQQIASIEVDSTTATVALDPEGFCGITVFEFGPPGFVPGIDSTAGPDGTVIILDGCPPFALGGLPELSTLDLYVRRYCPASGSFSGNTCGNSFVTGCRPPPVTIETTFADEENCSTVCGVACPLTGVWRNGPLADFDWIVHSGPVGTQGTGPQSDANGDGKYVYLESSGSNCQVGGQAQLLSACIQLQRAASDTCHFSFNYHMYGNSVGQLRLQITLNGGFSWQTIWQRTGDQGNEWHKEYLSLAAFPDNRTIQLRFVGTKGAGFRGDIGLDHLVFYGSILLGYPEQKYYVDQDGDDYGTGTAYILSCLEEAPVGYTDNNLDCNDNNPNINPGHPEMPCDGVDDNCNGFEDDMFLPSPVGTNDTICSGEVPEICAPASEGFLTAWYDSPELTTPIFIGPCFSPELPPNHSPGPIVYTFYAIETNFSCVSAAPTVVEVYVRPQPRLVLNSQPAICPGDTYNLAALNITDENFTDGQLSFHTASPAGPGNQLSNTIIQAQNDTVFYAMMVTAEGCTDQLALPLLISPGPDLSFSPRDSFILCKESSTTVTVQATGGSGNYQYFWDNGKTTSQVGIQAGKESGDERRYRVTVTDVNGCYTVDSVLVQTSNSIDSLYRRITNAVSCDGTEGSIALAPLTGVAPFSYQWSSLNGISGSITSAQDTFVINNLPQGSYRITITDSSSEQCAFSLRNVLVQGPGAVVQSVTAVPVSCGGAADGRINLSVIGNDPVYAWSNGSTTQSISQLSGGSYSVTITDGPCTTVLSDIEIFEPDPLGFRATMSPATCADAGDGQILLNLFGGNGSYALKWRSGATTLLRNNLAAGYYAFTLTDGNNCSLTDSVLVEAPAPLQIQVDSIQHLSCFQAGDGYLQVSGQGGTPPYRYNWSNGSSIPVLFDVAAGNYSLTITDFNGCKVSQTFSITQPAPLLAQMQQLVAPLCAGVTDGLIEMTATGGTAPYRYSWSDGNLTQNRSNLPAGIYEVTVSDDHGCNSPAFAIDLQPREILDPGITIVAPACVGPLTGSISLNPNGVGPYNVEWSGGSTALQLNNIATGSYGLGLSDSRGCRLDSIITVTAPQVFALNLSIEQPSCYGVTDGIVQVMLTKTGAPPFRFLWSDGATTQDRFTLGAGSYQLTISDANDCHFITDPLIMTEPEAFRIEGFDLGHVSCAGESNGYIEVDLVGGTKPYDINWVGQGVELPGIYEIKSGSYRLQAFDAQSCPIDTTFVINQPTALSLKVDITRGDPCDARKADSLKASATGGTPPYLFSWSNGATGAVLANAEPDDYNVTVTDANGCEDIIRSIKVRPREFAMRLDTFYVTDISCFGAADASMTAKVSGGSGRYTYLFRPARLYENTMADSITVTGLNLHNQYGVTITDVNTGCKIASPLLTVQEPSPLSIQLESITDVNCFGGTNGALKVKVVGGTTPYQYHWTNQQGELISENEDLQDIGSGPYRLLLTDDHGCTANFADSLSVITPPLLLTDTIIRPVACFGESSGGLDITVGGGKAPFSYAWSTGATSQDLMDVPAGSYALTITDAALCAAEFTDLEVRQQGSLLESETVTQAVSCYGASDGAVRVKINGGTPPYKFDWFRNGQPIANVNEAQLNNVPAGLYRLEFSDSQGCSRTFLLEVESPPDLSVNLQVNIPQPPDYTNGSASVVVTGGQPEYSYLWTTGDTTAVITDLSAGTYGLTVTDSNGCLDSIRLTLTDYVDPSYVQSARIFPNPVSEQLKVELRFPKVLNGCRLLLTDAFGRLIYQQALPAIREHLVPVDMYERPPGLYQIALLYQGRIIYAERVLVAR